jgi:hypothetical protein
MLQLSVCMALTLMYVFDCHEESAAITPQFDSGSLTVLLYSYIMVLAFQTQTLLYMHIGTMAVNSPIAHVMTLSNPQLYRVHTR